MTFVAERADGEVVAAARANASGEYRCLECGDRVVLRSAHRRRGELVRPHFMHPAGGESCSTGESEEHRWMKAMAYEAAQHRWPDASVEYEAVIGERRPDVVVRGGDTDGTGVAIEVQHRHLSKDVAAVVRDLLERRFSVLILQDRHFESGTVDLDAGIWRTTDESYTFLREDFPKISEWHLQVDEETEINEDPDSGKTIVGPTRYQTACGQRFHTAEFDWLKEPRVYVEWGDPLPWEPPDAGGEPCRDCLVAYRELRGEQP